MGYILDTIKKVVSEAFTQRRAKGYKDQTEELLRSHGYAIYYEGVCVNYGNPNFTGGSTFGTFVNAYEPLTTDGWMVLIGASAPYAARVESSTAYPSGEFKGYNKHVLIQMVEGLSTRIREKMGRKGAILKYGYILNSKLLGTVGKRHKIM